jgi:hypothetical protein
MFAGYGDDMPPDVPQPPPRPWKKGKHPDHEVVEIVIEICRDEHGRVFSSHRPLEESDEEVALGWPSGGMEQTAFALLTEAVRREAVLQVLVLASHKPELLLRLRDEKGEGRQKLLADVRERLKMQMNGTVARIAEGALEEAIRAISG